jgi:flagellar hook-associated protein 3 FlgL
MSRVSSAMIPQSALVDLGRAQRELIEAARQSSAQTRADDLKGYGREAQTLVSAQRLVARSEGFVATMREMKTRMELQDVALGRAAEAISQLKEDLFQNISLERGDGVRSHLEEAFAVLKDSMNTQLGGRFLFGGVLNDRQPVKATSLSNLAANPLATSIEQGAASQTLRIEDQRVIQTGVVADDVSTLAFASLKRLAELDEGVNGPFSGPLSATQKAAVEAEISLLGEAFNKMLEAQSENGRLLNDVDASTRRQRDQLEALNGAIGEIVNVDLAEVAVRLNQAQYSYEASASVFNTLRGLSLLNVLR